MQFKTLLLGITFLFILTTMSTHSLLIDQVEAPKLILNMENIPELPRNFRTAQDSFISKRLKEISSPPSRVGLNYLFMSGSSQFSKASLEVILDKIKIRRFIIVDLRQESHGFINDHAASWFCDIKNWGNLGLSPEEIEQGQLQLLTEVYQEGKAIVYSDKDEEIPQEIEIERVSTEAELAENYHVSYKRFYVSDHARPTDEIVDEFITFIKKLPKGTWLHFHCAGGKGRTTTFMSMYDMMTNAHRVTLEDILQRQWLIGGSSLEHTSNEDEWKTPLAEERLEFLRQFFQYCKEHPYFDITWSNWLEKNNKKA